MHTKLSVIVNLGNQTFYTMTKQEFLTLCEEKYPQVEKLNEIKDFYEYEKQFEKIMTDLSRTVLENNISKVPADRRKKKPSAGMGK